MNSKILGKNIRRLREEAEMPQIKLAGALGLQQAAFSRIENGVQGLLAIDLYRLSKLFDRPLDDFFKKEGV